MPNRKRKHVSLRTSLDFPSTSTGSTDTSSYVDIGDCDNVCEFCAALFWFDEHVASASTYQRLRYNQCCRGGHVVLPCPRRPFTTIMHLYQQLDFMANIRAYNSAFSMTSFGAIVDNTINEGFGPYVFKISGQIHHWIGTFCPAPGDRPRFLQMYIYDTENEISNRLHYFSNAHQSCLKPEIIGLIQTVLESCNELVKLFRRARDLSLSNETPSFNICLYSAKNAHCYDTPSNGTIGAIVTDNDPTCSEFDIIIKPRDGVPQRINKLHPLYMALQYPLLFPYGDKGWSSHMTLRTNSERHESLTINMYYSYLLHDRFNVCTLLLRGGRLLQQYIVDAYVCIEESRLDYIRKNQSVFRTEFLQGVHDAIQHGDTIGHEIGKRIYLPSSFVGGPRYMYKHYQDALAICRVHGNPQYFIMFTCNVKWPEIERYMSQYPLLKAQDRPDIIARVFQIKVKSMLSFLKNSKPFGEVAADLYTIEFQKRGLPHCHLLLWVTGSNKIKEASEIDNFISAKIPNPDTDPHLHTIVTDLMIHGPCGLLRPNLPCMSSGTFSKEFPKQYQLETTFSKNGYVHYKRRPNLFSVIKHGVEIDNRYVVPYNPVLCAGRIHYKITKSPANVHPFEGNSSSHLNKIQNFLDGRFICPHEAAWRILKFVIHDRTPPVQVLAVHLENMQHITFKDNDQLENVATNEFNKRSTLTEWLRNNSQDASGRHLRYIDYLKEYRWHALSKCWIRRSSSKTPAIGRLIYVHPTCGETFYLRMLLGYQRGCQSYKCIRTVNGVVCDNFRIACERLGLLGDDKEWSDTFEEAVNWATASELHLLFIQILFYCEVSNPLHLWNQQWSKMADDGQRIYGIVNDDDRKEYVLYELELLLRSCPSPSSLSEYRLPMPNPIMLQHLQNKLLMEERNYDRQILVTEHDSSRALLNPQQKLIYEDVMCSITSNQQILAFVYGHGGTGKTILWTTILAALRSVGSAVLAVAASGIASLLLPSGRTTHSRFKIPTDLTDQSICNIKKGSQLGQLLNETSLLIWDEAPMSDRRCFESLDRALRDICDNSDKPFGGKFC